jgi:uncharacterized protein YbaR (Trm112 family)
VGSAVKERLLDVLVCPGCTGTLILEADGLSQGEIMTGSLTCPNCRARYRIIDGVPRFLTDSSYADSFSFEWRRFRTVQLDSAIGTRHSETGFMRKTGLRAEDVRGRLLLDAGVGAGRYAEVVSAWDGEVVGVDLTRAVDAAFDNVGRRPNVHLVQADIFRLPLRNESFDIAYAIGVLHHTPDTREAFERVAATVKKGGQLAVYVYHAGGLARHFSDALRVVTTRLPHRVLTAASIAAGPLYYAYRLPGLGRLLQTVLPISMHPQWRWRWLDTFDWYSPRFQWKHTYPEVLGWFRAAGFTILDVPDEAICVRGVKA